MGRTRKSRGIITVFVTLIMVPVIVCTGIFVDAARIKLYSAQTAMTADAYGEVVLSEYDTVLKELYGLFAISQNQEGMDAVKKLAECTGYSFVPTADEDGANLSGFMPYVDAEVMLDYTPMPNAVLANEDVLMAQIADFMRFRGLECLANNVGLLDTLAQVDGASADMDAVSQRTKITKNSSRILGMVDDYYAEMLCIDDYPEYCDERIDVYEGYAAAMKQLYFEDEDYQDYLYYVNNRDEIEDAIKVVEDAEKADEEAEKASEDDEEITDAVDALSKETVDLAEKYRDYDAYAYKESIKNRLAVWDTRKSATNKKIQFDSVSSHTERMEWLAGEIDTCIATLKEQVTELETTLEGCSDGLRYGSDKNLNDNKGDGMEYEIAGLKEITDMIEDFNFTDMVEWFAQNDNDEDDDSNFRRWRDGTQNLEDIKTRIIDGEENIEEWDDSIRFDWKDFRDDPAALNFYTQLGDICNGYKNGSSASGVEGDEDAAENQIDNAEKVAAEAKEKSGLDKPEETKARSISSGLAKELEGATSSEEVKESEDFIQGFSIGKLGANAVSSVLLVMYDYEMFSSRVSGIEKKEDKKDAVEEKVADAVEEEGEEEEEYSDKSLTKVKMSKDVNYLYGAELEYLVAGHTSSEKNLTQARNIICGIRLASNFASTYSIQEINTTINALADAAATAVVAGTAGLGAAAYPLIKAAVSGALRLTVATLEMIQDWARLKDRESVVFYKSKLGDLSAIDLIADFLGDVDKSKLEKSGGFEMAYEDYLFLMLCITAIDRDNLLRRTADLITLNVNKSQTDNKDLVNDQMTSLSFKMNNAVTAIKSRCAVNLDFIIVPKNFLNMFVTDVDTLDTMQKLDEMGYGHSVIRGY